MPAPSIVLAIRRWRKKVITNRMLNKPQGAGSVSGYGINCLGSNYFTSYRRLISTLLYGEIQPSLKIHIGRFVVLFRGFACRTFARRLNAFHGITAFTACPFYYL